MLPTNVTRTCPWSCWLFNVDLSFTSF